MYSVNCELYASGVISKQEKGINVFSRFFFSRLFTVPYFLVRSPGSSAYRSERSSWFYMYRRGVAGVGVYSTVSGSANL